MTIKIKLSGGLGNQMFQFATGYAVAKKNKVRLSLDLKYINKRQLFNGFELENVFNIYSKISFLNKQLNFKSFNISEILNIFDKSFYNFYEPHYHYSQNILNLPKHSFLDGYWQSELYFKDYTQDIREIFSFSPNVRKENNLIIKDINNNNNTVVSNNKSIF